MLCGQPPHRASTTAGRGLQRKSCGGAPARPWPEPLQAARSNRRLRGSTARPPRHLELPCISSGYVSSLVLRARRSAAPRRPTLVASGAARGQADLYRQVRAGGQRYQDGAIPPTPRQHEEPVPRRRPPCGQAANGAFRRRTAVLTTEQLGCDNQPLGGGRTQPHGA